MSRSYLNEEEGVNLLGRGNSMCKRPAGRKRQRELGSEGRDGAGEVGRVM